MRLLSEARAVAGHPLLWPTALRQARRLAPTRWWATPPFLPLPPKEYVRLRMVTQYGDPDYRPDPDDVLSYLRWCRDGGAGR